MTAKEGIIRLGRSKSQKSRENIANTTAFRPNSTASSFYNDHNQQTNMLNRSLQLGVSREPHTHHREPLIINRGQPFNHRGFIDYQRVNQSGNRVNASPANSRSGSQHRLSATQKLVPGHGSRQKIEASIKSSSQISMLQKQPQSQGPLLLKIKVLQGRVQQLHQQKQATMARAYEQSRRVHKDMEMLQNKLKAIESVKNQQIDALKQEVKRLQAHVLGLNEQIACGTTTKLGSLDFSTSGCRQGSGYKQSKVEQTGVEIGKGTEQLQTRIKCLDSIVADQQRQIEHLEQQRTKQRLQWSKQKQEKVKQLQYKLGHQQSLSSLKNENEQLRVQLQQMKQMVVSTSAAIEENSQSIIQSYEHKLQLLSQELEQAHKKLSQQGDMQVLLADSQKKIIQYTDKVDKIQKQLAQVQQQLVQSQQQLVQVQQQLQEKDKLCEQYQRTSDLYKKEFEQSCLKLTSKSEAMTIQEQDLMARISSLSSDSQIQAAGAAQRIQSLEEQIQKLQAITANEKQKPQEPCKRCQELIRALSKLNQKSFAHTA